MVRGGEAERESESGQPMINDWVNDRGEDRTTCHQVRHCQSYLGLLVLALWHRRDSVERL